MKRPDTQSVILVGVGGQGTILASKILTAGLIEAGYDVKMSEVHGMSQRGGSVSTQVRYGEKVYSPIIGKGEADVLVSFETMEAIRCLDGLKPVGKVVVNDYKMPSFAVYSYEKKGNTSALCKVFPVFLYNSHFISAKNSRSILFGRYFGVESAAIPQTSESPYFFAICKARNT